MKSKLFFMILPLLLVSIIFISGQGVTLKMESLPRYVEVVTNKVIIYESADLNSNQISSALFTERLEVVSATGQFYFVKQNNQQRGYVLKAYVIDIENDYIELFADTNAKIIKEVYAFQKSGGILKQTEIKLEKETRVKALDGKSDADFALVTFAHNGELVTYYIETAAVDLDGVSARTLIAIMIIVSTVTLFWIFYAFFKGKRNE